MDLVEKVLSGNRLALARIITQIENQTESGLDKLDELFPHTGKAHLIGVTGSPGAGKSSLVNQLVQQMLTRPAKPDACIAVVAVDPTSPFSGGAVLGDRVRMRDLMTNPRVFIRSMASRGALGGLAQTTGMVTQALDAAGFETIIIETVGAGQTEVEIARLAHTVVVVEAPGMGDDIQAIKAGILEIADILVVNKSDHSGADNTVAGLRGMLELARKGLKYPHHYGPAVVDPTYISTDDIPDEEKWTPPVLQTIATQASGIEALLAEIIRHREYLAEHHLREQLDRQRLTGEFEGLMKNELYQHWLKNSPRMQVDALMREVQTRKISPHRAVHSLIAQIFPSSEKNLN